MNGKYSEWRKDLGGSVDHRTENYEKQRKPGKVRKK